MDVNTVVNLIGSVGFPIAMCIWMMKRMDTQDDKHREEITALRETVEKNTEAVTRLCERIDRE